MAMVNFTENYLKLVRSLRTRCLSYMEVIFNNVYIFTIIWAYSEKQNEEIRKILTRSYYDIVKIYLPAHDP